MKLFHGSYSKTAPVIKIGACSMTGDNVFDGIFGSADAEVAESHGNYVHAYHVEIVADSSDLNDHIEEVISYLCSEIKSDIDNETMESLAYAIADDECDEKYAEYLDPRSCSGDTGWEIQRLRGRVAAHLGFEAVEMTDEHGTSYLIVSPAIHGESV